jgi:sialate O-acetylesterase
MHPSERSAAASLCAGLALLLLTLSCTQTHSSDPPATTQPSTRPAAHATTARFAPIFSSNMVLQREMPLPVFGTARPGQRVSVTLMDQSRTAITDASGRWLVRFEPLSAGGPCSLSLTSDESTQSPITLTDILIGEVWVCSGQSNMEWLVSKSANATEEVAGASYPRIRINSSSASFVKASGREWVECSPKCVGNCSAVGYFFGRELHRDLNVPVGLVVRAVGGTVIKQWAPRSGPVVESDPSFKPLIDDWERAQLSYPRAKKAYGDWQATTRAVTRAATQSSTPVAQLPKAPPVPLDPNRYGSMYDAQIAPLMPFAFRGVIWYQGETDARTAHEDDQRSTLPLMIQAWRKAWGQGDFPFLLVQLANDWGGPTASKPPELPSAPPDNHHWPWVREAQALVCKLLPNTAMACTIDLGGKMHYPGKQDVGRRLAHLAEARVYHMPVIATGPAYDAMKIEGSRVRLTFTNVDGGLVTRGGATLQGFAIAGDDRKFVWAESRIDGDTIVVWSPKVPHPAAVRYDWLNDPHGNLYNAEGLPTAPFRTDDWPRVSEAR